MRNHNIENSQNNTDRLPIIRPQNWLFIQNWVKKVVKAKFGLEVFVPVDKSFSRDFIVLYTDDKLAKVEIKIYRGSADVKIFNNENIYGAKLVETEGKFDWKKLDLASSASESIASKIERFLNLKSKLEADQNYLKLRGLLEIYSVNFKNFDNNPSQVQIAAIKEAILVVENVIGRDKEVLDTIENLYQKYVIT